MVDVETPAVAAPQNAGAGESATGGSISHAEPSSDVYFSMLEGAGMDAAATDTAPTEASQADTPAEPPQTFLPVSDAPAGMEQSQEPGDAVIEEAASLKDELPETPTGEDLESQMTHIRSELTKYGVPKPIKDALMAAFFSKRDITRKTGFKPEDIKLIHEAGFTPKRALETLRMFPTDEDAKIAMRESLAFRQIRNDFVAQPDNFLRGLAASDPGAFRGVAERIVDVIQEISPEKYVSFYTKANAQLFDAIEAKATESGNSDLAVAAQLLREEVFQKTEKSAKGAKADIPEPIRQRLAEYEARDQQMQQAQQATAQQRAAHFEREVYSRTELIAADEILKMLNSRLPKDEFTKEDIQDFTDDILKGVRQDFMSNPAIVDQVQRLIASGPHDQNHLTGALTYIAQRVRPLIAPRAAAHIERVTARERAKQAARNAKREPILARRDPVVTPARPPAPPPPAKLERMPEESWEMFLNRATGI